MQNRWPSTGNGVQWDATCQPWWGLYFFPELSQFMISSPLNSSESDRRGRCLTWMGLIKRSMESRVLELLGKMEIWPFPFWTLIWTVLGGIRAEIISLLDGRKNGNIFGWYQFLCPCFLMLFVCNTELPCEYAKELLRICYDNWDESWKDLIYNENLCFHVRTFVYGPMFWLLFAYKLAIHVVSVLSWMAGRDVTRDTGCVT